MKKKSTVIVLLILLISTGVPIVYTCPLDTTFRAYLDRRFWQPFAKFVAAPARDLPPQSESTRPFAGLAGDEAKPALQAVRDAYGPLSSGFELPSTSPELQAEPWIRAHAAVVSALQTELTEEEKEEVRLVDAKIDMREGEAGRQEALQRAQDKLRGFLSTAKTPALASEARGWLAHVYYLCGDFPSAAKIYLDELLVADSALNSGTLLTSIRLVFFDSDKSKTHLADHLDEYFDTPGHALFVVNLLINPSYQQGRPPLAAVAQKTITSLQNHGELFRSGAESEALALALMRAALFMGDPGAALRYSQMVPRTSLTAKSSEFNWLTAVCHFLGREYAAAEGPLLRMYHSPQADERDHVAAAQALIGVYQKLGRPVDQLHAAFLYYPSHSSYPYMENQFVAWPYTGWLLDLPYLLDIQLTAEELDAYLRRYRQSSGPIFATRLLSPTTGQRRTRSAAEIVEYALEVRYARQEKYQEDAALYQKLGSWPRAQRMGKLAQLYAEADDAAHTGLPHLEARYAYAAFLADHPNQIFFNDTLWSGSQTEVFIEQYRNNQWGTHTPPSMQGLTREERELFLQLERRLRDEQEEWWRAYKILAAVVDEAGDSALGRRAARKAVDCLARINTERFGRAEEVAAARRSLAQWLRQPSVTRLETNSSRG
ncbi:MAG: hypothetical protein HY268_29835 [Deltaproteobacteria bacterium]|nr:hypothetical protein [Deltaproteobacteria bacterium]